MTETALRERLELIARVEELTDGAPYSGSYVVKAKRIPQLVADIEAALSSAEAREEAERRADTTSKLGRFLIECADLQRQAAETRAQQAEARVEELTAALHGMRRAFGDPLTRRALGGHNERQQLAMTAARQALSAIPSSEPCAYCGAVCEKPCNDMLCPWAPPSPRAHPK